MDQSLAVEDESGVDAMTALGLQLKGHMTVINASVQEPNLDWMLLVVQVCDSADGVDRWVLNKKKINKKREH